MKKRITALLLAFVLVLGLLPAGAMADGEELFDVSIDVTFGQTEARNMLQYINAFRLGQDVDGQLPDYWNSDNTTKTDLSGQLSPLTYDYALERTAMQRAAETAVYWDHTRPEGSSCFTAWPDGFYSRGENIAAGYGFYTQAYEVFVGWREDEDDFSGQGHRRNMLSGSFTRIGIGHVVYNGVHYWTQAFGNGPADDAATEAADDTRTMNVTVNTGAVTQISLSASAASCELRSGESAALPSVTASFLMTESWPGYLIQGGVEPVWTSEDSSIAMVDGGSVAAYAAGTTNLTASLAGASVTVPVTVTTEGGEVTPPPTPTVTPTPDPTVVASGICGAQGDNLTWKIDTNGVLTISGEGEMEDYPEEYPGWYDILDQFTSVVIEPGATSIGDYAFFNCYYLEKVTIPDTVQEIGVAAFMRCDPLNDVTVPGSVASIGDYAFASCESLENIVLEDGLESIGYQAFKYCGVLKKVEIPDTVASIDDYAFADCIALTDITIPANTSYCGYNPFAGCSSLTGLKVDRGNRYYTVSDGVLFNNDMSVLVGCPDTKSSYSIPDTVTEVRIGAFSGAAKLENIVIPGSVNSIGDYAFEDCESLMEITFEGSAPSFGNGAFYWVTATVYYPAIFPSWTENVMQDYGGDINWVPVGEAAVPEITGVDMSTAGLELSWSDVPGASKYQVDKMIGGRWTTLGTELYGTSLTDATLASADKASYRVRAYVGSAWTGYSAVEEVVFNPFSDIPSTGKTFEYVSWAYNNGIVNGTSSTTFTPDDPCTRAQFVMMLWKMNGSPEVKGVTNPFSDVTNGTKTCRAVLWALKEGIIVSGDRFNPNGNISRVQIVMMLWKMAGSPKITGVANPFKDVSGTKTTNAVLWAYDNGITKGTSNTTFAPDNPCTRLQLVIFLYKFNNL